jgi:phosphate transport system protein
MQEHIVKAYDQELEELTGKIADIARMSRMQLDSALEAFQNRDKAGAKRIIERDSTIDHLEHDINRLTVYMLAARQPLAVDLRTIISALKIATDLERVADYTVNIAKQVLTLNGALVQPSLQESVIKMMHLVRDMLDDVLEAYEDSNVEKALAIRERDSSVDAIYSSLLAELRVCMSENSQHVTACTALLFMARCLERMGDHIKNVAEDIYFIVTGELYEEEPPSV